MVAKCGAPRKLSSHGNFHERTRPGASGSTAACESGGMTRAGAVAFAAVLLLGTSACFAADNGRQEPSQQAKEGCDPCTAEVAEVRKELEAQPEITAVTRIEWAPRNNITQPPVLSVDLNIKAGTLDPARLAALKA